MRTDYENWKPLAVDEMNNLFYNLPVQWCIAGGWALDLHIGSQTRKHGDVDVLILREEQLTVYRHLSQDWMLYKAENGELELWREDEYLDLTGDVWACKDDASPWAFQLMLVETEQDDWIYRREQSIRRALRDITLKSPEGIPYLRPEIQLLYKGGSKNIRSKDHDDFHTILPSLSPQEIEWLASALRKQFPEGHAWVDIIRQKKDSR
ncbi:nucleotidyltransferase domain-containing protein [Paenibacillus harenae]|uniref:nucleotidyltransferase domain-containing protein n=1 Tax=Paenibacillus harenae TaxID=306543 RepID=UPI0003FB9ABB|nr:hypothetical protein [Paenibacillus harenae]